MNEDIAIDGTMDLGKRRPLEAPATINESALRNIIRECMINMFENLDEKAKSKAQQRFMGMVRAVQKGELDADEVGASVAKAAKTMKKKDAKDFAETKHKGLPNHVTENELVGLIRESVQEELVDVLAKYVKGEATAEEANKAIMNLANSSNMKINESLDPKTANYFEQIKRGERDSLDYNGQIYEVTPQLRKLAKQISEQFGLEVYPYVYQNDVRIFCALEIQNNGDEINYDTIRELENELSKYGLHCAASFGRKYMTYVKQIREKDR